MKIPRRAFVGSSLAAIAGGPLLGANSKSGNSKSGSGARREAELYASFLFLPAAILAMWLPTEEATS